MFQHPYLQNLDDATITKYVQFALNNVDQLLTYNTPQQRQEFIRQYFTALITLVVVFNDRINELESKLGIVLDSTKLLNILQKLSFYKEFRESPYLIQFQKTLNLYLENYPNEVTMQFIHIKPIEPLKFDKKKSRKEIVFKLFGPRTRARRVSSQVQPTLKIVDYTSKEKLYNDTEHIKTDKSRFYSKLFRSTDDFTGEADKAKARAAFEKIQNKDVQNPKVIQDQLIAQAQKEKEERLLKQKITLTKNTPIKAQPAVQKDEIAILKQFNKKQNILQKIKGIKIKLFKSKSNEKLVIPVIKAKTKAPTSKKYELPSQEGFSNMDSFSLHHQKENGDGESLKNSKRKPEDYEQYKEQKKLKIEKFFDKLFNRKKNPYTPKQLEEFKLKATIDNENEVEKILKGQIQNQTTPLLKNQPNAADQRKSVIYKTFRGVKIFRNKIKDFFYRNYTQRKLQQKAKVNQKKQPVILQQPKPALTVKLDEKTVIQQANATIRAMDEASNKEELLKSLVSQSKQKPKTSTSLLSDKDLDVIRKNSGAIQDAMNTWEKAKVTDNAVQMPTMKIGFFTKLIRFITSPFNKPRKIRPVTVKVNTPINFKPQPVPVTTAKKIEMPHITQIKDSDITKPSTNKPVKPVINKPNVISTTNKKTSEPIKLESASINIQNQPSTIQMNASNPFAKLANLDSHQFITALEKMHDYTEEQVEELMYYLEQTLLQRNTKGIFLNFENLDSVLINNILKIHSKYLKNTLNIEDRLTSDTIKKYNVLLEFLETHLNLTDLTTKYTDVNFENNFVISQYIAFRFREKMLSKYFGEYQLEKILSLSEVDMNGQTKRDMGNLPTKIFELHNLPLIDDNQIDINTLVKQEEKTSNIAILFTVEEKLELLKKQIAADLIEKSRQNLLFTFNNQLREAISYSASEAFLTLYAKKIYINLQRGDLNSIKLYTKREFKRIASEFLQSGFNQKDKFGLTITLYQNLKQLLDKITKYEPADKDILIEETIKSVYEQILEWQIIPETFFKLNFRKCLNEERIYYDITYALDVYIIPEFQDGFEFEKYHETYVLTLTEESRSKIYENTSTVKVNPDYIQKIINIAYGTNKLKENLTDLTYKLKYKINKDISLANDLI